MNSLIVVKFYLRTEKSRVTLKRESVCKEVNVLVVIMVSQKVVGFYFIEKVCDWVILFYLIV